MRPVLKSPLVHIQRPEARAREALGGPRPAGGEREAPSLTGAHGEKSFQSLALNPILKPLFHTCTLKKQ